MSEWCVGTTGFDLQRTTLANKSRRVVKYISNSDHYVLNSRLKKKNSAYRRRTFKELIVFCVAILPNEIFY
jgi:hypothetical protein